MTLRERIADWLTGGALSKARGECVVIIDGEYAVVTRGSIAADNARLVHVLRAISAEAKRGKNPNATVRRIGKMADEPL